MKIETYYLKIQQGRGRRKIIKYEYNPAHKPCNGKGFYLFDGGKGIKPCNCAKIKSIKKESWRIYLTNQIHKIIIKFIKAVKN